ncbi:penicillin-binding protein activator LpoB [candidate division WOR-3 bacterium]|nr:penicillin-binding protein activator LpoB [candidate division WOR-3 bacterium]
MKDVYKRLTGWSFMFGSFFLLLSLILAGCATTTYVRSDEVTEVDETFTDTDLKLMSEKMVQSIAELAVIKHRDAPPKIAMLNIGNRTSQHIDTEGIAEKIMVALLKTGAVRFVDRNLLKKMAREKALVETQQIDVQDAVMLGQLVGANYFLAGDIMSIEKKKGTTYIAYYKLTLKLVDVKTSEIVWADEKEIKKSAKKGFFDW